MAEREREIIPLEEFTRRLRAQGVPREHAAFICPVCGTVQSAALLLKYATEEQADRALGYSCVGRYSRAGAWVGKPSPAGPGCNWTLGGLLRIHELEVQTVPWFRVASPGEAQALMKEVSRG